VSFLKDSFVEAGIEKDLQFYGFVPFVRPILFTRISPVVLSKLLPQNHVYRYTVTQKSPNVIRERATADAQLWNDLLCCSGGALEIPKCAYHLAHFGFSAAGAPVLQTLQPQQQEVQIQECSNSLPTSLKYLPPNVARKNPGMLQISVHQHQGQPSTHHRDSPREIRYSSPQFHHCQKCTPVLLLGFPSECDIQLSHQHHSGEPTPKNPKLMHATRMGCAKSTPQAILYGPDPFVTKSTSVRLPWFILSSTYPLLGANKRAVSPAPSSKFHPSSYPTW
jgi:hypothetical protein